jgi:hypothetical protein
MLTYDAVVAAIGQIRERGQRPSLSLILRETGGSKTDISRLFKRWRDEQAATAAAPPPPEIAALAALSPDLATRIRQAYEKQSYAAITKAQEDLALAQQHVEDLHRSLGDAEAAQAQLRTEFEDRAQMERRLVDAIAQGVAAMARQQSPLLDAIAALERIVRDMAERQNGLQASIDAVQTRCGDLVGEMDHAQDAIAGLHVEVQERATALSTMVRSALDQQMTATRDLIAADRTALLRDLQVRHLASVRDLRTALARPVDQAPLVTRITRSLGQRNLKPAFRL